MVGQGTDQWRILQKLLECAPLAIMAEQLAAVGAKGQKRGELALLIVELAAAALLSGDGKGEEAEEKGENRDRPGAAPDRGEGLVNGAPGQNRQRTDGVGGEGADVVKQKPDRQKEEEKSEISAQGTGQQAGQGEAGENGRESAPAAEVLA
jgi:hypothetical protein